MVLKDVTRKRLRKMILFLLWGICLFGMNSTVNAKILTGFSSKLDDSGSVLLEWNSDDESAIYQVQRKTANGKFSVIVNTTEKKGKMIYYDNEVSFGKTYYYKLLKYDGEELLEESEILKITIGLSQPKKVKATKIKETKVKLHWQSVNQATGYEIYRSVNKKKGYKKLITVKNNSFIDTTVKSGQAYFYKIRAIRKNTGKSAWSDIVVAYIKPATPQVTGKYAENKIKLVWKKVSGADSYYIYKKNSKNVYKRVGKTKKLYYIDQSVKKGKTYQYKVIASYVKNKKQMMSRASQPCKILATTIDPNKKMVALTFDDGPGQYTQDIVNCLKANNAKATFFVVGSQINAYASALKNASKMGCEIGNHSYTHPNFANLSDTDIYFQINETDKKIKSIIGKSTDLLRTPGGYVSDNVRAVVKKPIILWSIDTRDWETLSKEKTVSAVKNNVQDGDIILMHDVHKPTRDAACELIVWLKKEGYQMVTVSEMAQYRKYTLNKGTVYRRFPKK